MSIQRLYAGRVEQLDDDEVAGICVSAGVKRDGDAWEPTGVDLTAFRRNPVILRDHTSAWVIGTAPAIGLTPDRNAIAVVIKFAPPGLSVVADEARALAKCGALRGISAGIDPIDVEPLRDGTRGLRIVSSELIEISLVATPADADALITARSFLAHHGTAAMVRSLPAISESAIARALEQVGRMRESRPFDQLSRGEQVRLIEAQRQMHANALWAIGQANELDERERERRYSREQRQADIRRLSQGISDEIKPRRALSSYGSHG